MKKPAKTLLRQFPRRFIWSVKATYVAIPRLADCRFSGINAELEPLTRQYTCNGLFGSSLPSRSRTFMERTIGRCHTSAFGGRPLKGGFQAQLEPGYAPREILEKQSAGAGRNESNELFERDRRF